MKSLSVKWGIIVLCVLFGLSILWMSRYVIFTTTSIDGRGVGFKLDRFTGEVSILVHERGSTEKLEVWRLTEHAIENKVNE
jgi:hypothetical protein